MIPRRGIPKNLLNIVVRCVGILLAPDLLHCQHTIRWLSTGMATPTLRKKDVLRYSFLVCMAQKDFACVCIIKVTMLVCITNTSRTVIHCILKFSQILIGPEIKQAERVFQEGTFAWDHARCIRRAGLRKLFH